MRLPPLSPTRGRRSGPSTPSPTRESTRTTSRWALPRPPQDRSSSRRRTSTAPLRRLPRSACPAPRPSRTSRASTSSPTRENQVVERVAGHRHGGPLDRQQPGLLDPAADAGRHPSGRVVRHLRLHRRGTDRRGRRLRPRDRAGLGVLPAARCRTATTESISITEITPTVVTTVSTGNVLPPALVVGDGDVTVPGTYAPPSTGPGFNIETITPVDPEPLRRSSSGRPTRGCSSRSTTSASSAPGQPQFGEIYVTTKPDELKTPRGGTYIKSYARDADRTAADHADQRPGPGGERRRRAHRRHDRARSTGRPSVATRSRRPPSAPTSTSTSTPTVADRAGRRPAGHRDVQRREPRSGRPAGEVRPARGRHRRQPEVARRHRRRGDPGQQWCHRRRRRGRGPDPDQAHRRDQNCPWRPGIPVDADRPGRRRGRRTAGWKHPLGLPLQPRPGDPGAGHPTATRRPRSEVSTALRRHRSAQPQPRPGRPDEHACLEQLRANRSPPSSSSRAARSSSWPTTSTPRAATRAPTAGSSHRTGPPRSSARCRPPCSTPSSSRSSRPTRTPTSCWPETSTTTSSRRRSQTLTDNGATLTDLITTLPGEPALHVRLQRGQPGARPHLRDQADDGRRSTR